MIIKNNFIWGDMMQKNTESCCPEFNVDKWDDKTLNWKDKPFITESMPVIFHIPFPWIIKKKIMKLVTMAMDAGANESEEDTLLLFSDIGSFRSEIFLSVTEDIAKAENVKFSGEYISKVFDGPYKHEPLFMKEMDWILSEKGKTAKRYYVHYAYCPKCSKKYGHNYMVLFAKV